MAEQSIETGRFGKLQVEDRNEILVPAGVLGFPELKRFCMVDPGDETLILWLQSIEKPQIVFPLLEPKIFHSRYLVRLSAAEMRELKINQLKDASVFSILTIGSDITQMTANLKAPFVLNLQERIGRQVVLQENEFHIKHPMFKELRQHWVTIHSQMNQQTGISSEPVPAIVSLDRFEGGQQVGIL